MALPDPVPGLVIGYSYLWRDEAIAGREEGRKDRPCVIVLSVRSEEGRIRVSVAPVTHFAPTDPEQAVKLPEAVKQRLGMDAAPSWIVISELNHFIWPGADLRLIRRGSPDYAYGILPRTLYNHVRDRMSVLVRAGRIRFTRRDL